VSKCRDVAEITVSSRCLSLTSSNAVESSEEETDWAEEISSREGSPGVSQRPRSLSPAKRRVVDAMLQEFRRIVSQYPQSHTIDGSSSDLSSGGTGGWSSNTSTYSSVSIVSWKRSLSGGDSTPPNDDDDSNKQRRPDSKPKGKAAHVGIAICLSILQAQSWQTSDLYVLSRSRLHHRCEIGTSWRLPSTTRAET
jgi:hypothetical protein